jgi:hypothetical protein
MYGTIDAYHSDSHLSLSLYALTEDYMRNTNALVCKECLFAAAGSAVSKFRRADF